jgi:hypothetical protein
LHRWIKTRANPGERASLGELARMMGVGIATARRWYKTGALSAVVDSKGHYHIRKSAIRRLLASRESAALAAQRRVAKLLDEARARAEAKASDEAGTCDEGTSRLPPVSPPEAKG